MDWKKFKELQQQQIELLHKELGWFNEEELENTARRVTNFYKEFVDNTKDFNFTTFESQSISNDVGMIVLKNISFHSLCSHHLLPFYGEVDIAYLPKRKGRVCGVSKLARTVRKFASKPQIQEKLTNEIADFIYEKLQPSFVMVRAKAKHLCMIMRGIKQHDSVMATSAIRWSEDMKNNLSHLKEEALMLFDV